MLFGKKKYGRACMRCGSSKKIDGDELMCSSCIDEINLRTPPNLVAPNSNEEKPDLPLRASSRLD